MKIEQLEHIIRAAAVIADDDELIIIGSQSIPIETPATRGATGWCLHPRDLALAKLAARREKDLRFVGEMARAQLLQRAELERLAVMLRASIEIVTLVQGRIRGCFTS